MPLAAAWGMCYNVGQSAKNGEEGARAVAWYVYMLLCSDGTLYTGMTDDVPRRLRAHRSGRGAKYTRGRGPLTLVYTQEQPSRSAALRREYQIKRLSRAQKDALRSGWPDQPSQGETEKETAPESETPQTL